MVDPYARETIQNWIGDFCAGDEVRAFDAALRDAAPALLERFLAAACDARDIAPGDVEEPDLRRALLDDVATLAIDERVRADVPALCGEFLADLERRGRLGGGRALGAFVRALKPAWLASTGKAVPYARPGTPVGRNDPCPCGSGQKYKKCCMNRLG